MHEGSYWSSWVLSLRRRGLNAPAAVFLETLGPLAVILAQAIYVGQPFLKGLLPGEQAGALVRMLEDHQQRCDFVAFLEEDVD
jgi:hypothetical protein